MQAAIEHWSESLELPGLPGQLARRAAELLGHPATWDAVQLSRAERWRSILFAGQIAALTPAPVMSEHLHYVDRRRDHR